MTHYSPDSFTFYTYVTLKQLLADFFPDICHIVNGACLKLVPFSNEFIEMPGFNQSLIWLYMCTWQLDILALADPGGGAHPARAPPNGRGPMIFLCPKR